jgi:hypothetical protein
LPDLPRRRPRADSSPASSPGAGRQPPRRAQDRRTLKRRGRDGFKRQLRNRIPDQSAGVVIRSPGIPVSGDKKPNRRNHLAVRAMAHARRAAIGSLRRRLPLYRPAAPPAGRDGWARRDVGFSRSLRNRFLVQRLEVIARPPARLVVTRQKAESMESLGTGCSAPVACGCHSASRPLQARERAAMACAARIAASLETTLA